MQLAYHYQTQIQHKPTIVCLHAHCGIIDCTGTVCTGMEVTFTNVKFRLNHKSPIRIMFILH